ncbi:MAG: hypothetical protein KatS3mg114_1148 [Planctomycetaceae bacterium]|nr:MAG: hypothetical protein KatS3mg114_1148 [Planctomycetaceae bacterium]
MRQVLQSLRDGETWLAELPCPQVRAGCLLIQTRRTLISAGTERMLQEFGRACWWGKARQQPEKVRQVLQKVRTDGLFATLEVIGHKLDEPLPLGYCNVGRVVEVGPGVEGFRVGDRVLSNGPHAEVVCVPRNLCTRIPEEVSDDEAVFGVLGAIALQGIRLAEPTLGECFVVLGLGLIGLLAVQLLQAHGVRVLGADYQLARLELARQFGAEVVHLGQHDLLHAAEQFSRQRGVDGVLITAATQSVEPIQQAAKMARKRGRIVLTGTAGLQLNRQDFYEKELSFQVSCSYGPGRYDPAYEQQGHDYPIGYVRWTEQRNFEAVLDMLSGGRLQVRPLISHRFPLSKAVLAYELISSSQPSLGVLLDYEEQPLAQLLSPTVVRTPSSDWQIEEANIVPPRVGGEGAPPVVKLPWATSSKADDVSHDAELLTNRGSPKDNRGADPVVVAVVGAGNFCSRHLLPAFKRVGVRLKWIASRGGRDAAWAAWRYGIERATTTLHAVYDDPEVEAVVIATRHDSHAELVCRALDAGKHVFVEKPLALHNDELQQIRTARERASNLGQTPIVTVGFNRRLAPQVRQMQQLLSQVSAPKVVIISVNAGDLPADHWLHDRQLGGGRFIGEGCHFVDVARALVGQPIIRMQAMPLQASTSAGDPWATLTCNLQFADGSWAAIHYLANGHRGLSKERIEVFTAGRILQLDNFRILRGYGWRGFRSQRLWWQDKGHTALVRAFVQGVRHGLAPIPWSELWEVSRVTLDVVQAAQTGQGCEYHGHTGPAGMHWERIGTATTCMLPQARSA